MGLKQSTKAPKHQRGCNISPKGCRALLRIPSTEGRSVCLCWAPSKPQGPKGPCSERCDLALVAPPNLRCSCWTMNSLLAHSLVYTPDNQNLGVGDNYPRRVEKRRNLHQCQTGQMSGYAGIDDSPAVIKGNDQSETLILGSMSSTSTHAGDLRK